MLQLFKMPCTSMPLYLPSSLPEIPFVLLLTEGSATYDPRIKRGPLPAFKHTNSLRTQEYSFALAYRQCGTLPCSFIYE